MAKKPIRKLDGLPVIDATHDLLLTVTRTDIRRSVKKEPNNCAAAVALCRQSHIREARVYIARAFLRYSDHWKRFMTPKSMRTEIVSFDRGASFTPGGYVLKAPTPSERLGFKAYQPRSPHRAIGKQKRPHHVLTGVREHGPHGAASRP